MKRNVMKPIMSHFHLLWPTRWVGVFSPQTRELLNQPTSPGSQGQASSAPMHHV